MPNPAITNTTSAQRPLDRLFYERFGIRENPFGVTPNSRYLYQSRTHGEARATLIVGIECGVGFQALIAPPGMGKTTILFNILEQYNDIARTAFLFQIQGDSRDFLRYLTMELGGDPHESDLVRMQDAINQLLIREHRAGKRALVIIDEAQNLDTPVLETLRLLSNFETPNEKLFQIILAGQPQLAQRLATPELANLYQRISIRTTLIPFDLEDTRNYIEHRLKVAGYQGPPLFTPAVMRSILERSSGVPREINTLCFNSMLLATVVKQKQVDSDILHEVVTDLDLNSVRFHTDTPARDKRDLRSANPVCLGDVTAADPTSTSTDKAREAAVAAARAESDEDAVRSVPSDPPASAGHLKTDGMAAARPRAAGLPSCETKIAGKSAEVTQLSSQALDAPAANGAATRVRLKPFILPSLWIAAIVVLVATGPSLMHHHNGGAHNVRAPFRRPQQDRRTINSAIGRIPTESSARETTAGEGPASSTVVENSHEKPPSGGKVPNIGENATPVSGGARSLGAASGADQAGLVAHIVPARLVHQVKPVYPPAAVEAGIRGRVVMQVVVDKGGAVRDVQLISGPPDLAHAAVDAVKSWQYQPASIDGQPIEFETQVTMRFVLH